MSTTVLSPVTGTRPVSVAVVVLVVVVVVPETTLASAVFVTATFMSLELAAASVFCAVHAVSAQVLFEEDGSLRLVRRRGRLADLG